jgi:manganese oxidase
MAGRGWRIARVGGVGALALALFLLGVTPAAAGARRAEGGRTRTYYIAADEVPWDYAPPGKNLISGEAFGDDENVYVAPGPQRIGRVYKKSLYREYTNRTFTTLKPRPAAWAHLGELGPVIHAEVGDTIKVVLKNNTGLPTSMHPHGVFYDKASEGAPYDDGVPDDKKPGDSVEPGQTFTYTWKVPERTARARTTRARSCGCTTRTSTRSPTPTPGSWGRSSSLAVAWREPTGRPRMSIASSSRCSW